MSEDAQKTGENLLIKFLISTMSAFNIVENPAFRSYSKFLHSTFKIPSKTIRNKVHKMGTSMKQKVIQEMDSLQSKVFLTTDGWTDINNRQFMATTAHYITHEYDLRDVVLSISCVPPRTMQTLLLSICNLFAKNLQSKKMY